ncbi:cellulose biosynthesis cyclic di-GMP-binding regulatory protein BcsB, partial [Mesorhizobium sp. M8A.F.Ca.ET.202.01.1.1]|uniref:cellulose biosynthesis cyclic di-GMP-binding regulatory protein BcsB n=1 Tax=Mesorhizobium sp. M8A.F.Ca.ET.202.01.1.1 TaxID=2563967 RepID=UPI001AED7C02
TNCEDPANSSLWATVSNASSLDLTYASLASKPDLAALPQPFFDRRDVRRLELPFVFPQKPRRPGNRSSAKTECTRWPTAAVRASQRPSAKAQ